MKRIELKNVTANLELKDATLAFKLGTSDDERIGVITGYASMFDIQDQGRDTMKKGSFQKSLDAGRPVRMLWQHDPSFPIGVWDKVVEDEKGLYVEGRILADLAKGAETLTLIKNDAVGGLSIGYQTVNATKSDKGGRDLNEVNLWEVSVVTFPMLPEATVHAKHASNVRDFERKLREVFNFSQKEAKAIIADGWEGLNRARDVTPEAKNEGLEALTLEITQLKEKLK